MTEENAQRIEQAKRALAEALRGTSSKSKTSLIKEALRALEACK